MPNINEKAKVLLLLKVPPPITGATLMNQRLLGSGEINRIFNIRSILVSYQEKIKDFGKVKLGGLYKVIKTLLRLIYELIFFRPHLIYFQITLTGASFFRDSIFVLIMKLFRSKLLFHFRVKGFSKRHKVNGFMAKYFRVIFRGTSIIVLSHLLVREVKDFLQIEPFVVYNGYPVETPSILKESSGVFQIIFLSNLLNSKGVIDFIDIIQIISDKGYDFHAHIIGADGDYTKSQIRNIIKGRRLSNRTTVWGALYGENKFEILRKAHLLVYPSHNDAFGGVIIDAMQFCIPVIAYKEGSIPVIIDDGESGFVIPSFDVMQVADKVEYFLNMREEVNAFGQNGRQKFLREFTFEQYEKNMIAVFKQILSIKE